MAMKELVARAQEEGRTGVWVPHASSKKCQWVRPEKRGYGTWMPWETMLDVLEFALENTYVKMPDGRILKQVSGIPMGDSMSPGMTIGTCAWMESEWFKTIEDKDRGFLEDSDIWMVYA